MRIFRSADLAVALGLFTFSTFGKLIVVNTTNNISPGLGETNLVQAIGALEEGDTIGFNIPGNGPFYLITPPFLLYNGYPAITNNNVTIDGYTQPGSAPNSNTILSSNNARIQIVLDARDGLGYHSEEITGAYGLDESEQLLIKLATNVTVRGLCFLGPGKGMGNGDTIDPYRYAISFALGAHDGHVCGCWFGVDLDGTSVYRFRDAVNAFRVSPDLINGTVVGVAKNAAGPSDARAQFNVIVGEEIPVALEGQDFRISGNFFNVFPDGMTDYNVNGMEPHDLEAFIEIGRAGNNVVIGTDGDGVNDLEERNIFGGVTQVNDPTEPELIQWYSGARTNIVIAGNYFGVATDGVTRFTNAMALINGLAANSTVRIGSDFDGVSDDIEANVIAMNYPFDSLYPSPGPPGPPPFARLQVGARVSLRGNQLIGNNDPPFTYADGYFDLLPGLTNYCARFMSTNQVIPVLATNSNQGRLRGSCAVGVAPYTNVIIDVYLADEEGWTNGQKFQLLELSYTNSDGSTQYYGFAQGRVYLGSFVDNGPEDLDPTPGEFDFDIRALGLDTTSLITVAANYSADPAGTHNGRTHTSDFAMPITLQPAPTISVIRTDTGLELLWPTNAGIFTIQSTPGVVPASWADVVPQPDVTVMGTNYQAEIIVRDASRFYRLAR